jgi:hypothetical protein
MTQEEQMIFGFNTLSTNGTKQVIALKNHSSTSQIFPRRNSRKQGLSRENHHF